MASHAAATGPSPAPSDVPQGASRASQTAAEPAAMTHRQIMEALTGLLAAFFTAILSSTIVANALPTIMSELKGTQTDFAWVITAALLANAATTPIWGKLADLFNKKVLVQLSIVIFVAGSVMAGLSETIPLLLTARVIQGIAMGGLTALAQAIIGSMIPPRDRGKYSGYMGGVMAVGTAGGPLLGGFIVDSPLGWRWTFFVCVPLAVVALILLQVTLKIPHVKRPAKIDWLGSILLTSGVSLLLIWVSFAGNPDYYDWWSWQTVAMVGGGIVLLGLLVLVESKVPQPIIPLKIISERTTALAILASVAVGVGMFGSSTFLGQYFQVARGATPTEAGLLTLPMIAGNLIGSVVSGHADQPHRQVEAVPGRRRHPADRRPRPGRQHGPHHRPVADRYLHGHPRRRPGPADAEPRPRRAEHGPGQGHRHGQRLGGLLPVRRRCHRRLGPRRRAGQPGQGTRRGGARFRRNPGPGRIRGGQHGPQGHAGTDPRHHAGRLR